MLSFVSFRAWLDSLSSRSCLKLDEAQIAWGWRCGVVNRIGSERTLYHQLYLPLFCSRAFSNYHFVYNAKKKFDVLDLTPPCKIYTPPKLPRN